MVHCSTGDQLPPYPMAAASNLGAGPAEPADEQVDHTTPTSKRKRVPFRLMRKQSMRPAPLPSPASPPAIEDVPATQIDSESPPLRVDTVLK
eukprot:3238464-Amphidinium_carterae.1